MNKLKKPNILWLIVVSCICANQDKTWSKDICPDKDGKAVTTPAPVDIAVVLETIANLKTKQNKPALDLSTTLVKEIHEVFDTHSIKTKMEQFYSLLFVFQKYLPTTNDPITQLDGSSARQVLLSSKVFSTTDIPNHVVGVDIDRSNPKLPHYTITFDQDQLSVPLNHGEGFYLYRNGMCQHAQKLIFEKKFSVVLYMNKKNHLVADKFNGVDLFGNFGNKGVIDVDINYVSLRSVEFYRGTPDGKVTAYVSREEFKKNTHNFLLNLISRIVPDRSVQPIDW